VSNASQSSWLTVRVAAKYVEATDICCYELVSPDGLPLPPFTAGAHIDVRVRRHMVRQYSLCNAPHERHRYVIAVLSDPDSRGGSLAMRERVEQGDLLEISAPKNHFPLHPHVTHSVLIAGGIGVTPLLCMAYELNDNGASFVLHYCARSRDRMAFVQTIAQSAFAARVRFHLDDGDVVQQLDINRVLATVPAGAHLYVCGPVGFISMILDTADKAGWPAAQIHREYFAAAPIDTRNDKEFVVQLARSGRTITVAANESIVQVLARHGVDIPVSCEQGVCGTCLTAVVAGEPEHRDVYLTDAEHASNKMMMPCCSRSRSERLVLDL
jgi:vanillate monooxygenase ferredoxin subunit